MSKNGIWLAAGLAALAALAALAYILIALGVLTIGTVAQADSPAGIVYVSAGSYFAGGLLILLRRRWLWIVGLVMNTLVLLFFGVMYASRPSVMFSPGGLATKIAQILLELALVYLIAVKTPHLKAEKIPS